jgi:hypothetical protein
MTAQAQKVISGFERQKNALRDALVRCVKSTSPEARTKAMFTSGVLTKDGKLAPAYRKR